MMAHLRKTLVVVGHGMVGHRFVQAAVERGLTETYDVVVVGGGDSAFDWALALHPIARSVTLVHRRARFRAHPGLVRKVEDLGYHRLTVSDHLDDQLSPVAALMAAADATSTLRVGALVFCNDYRHPAVLAKEAATLDILSEGRFELGLGAGWPTEDTPNPSFMQVDYVKAFQKK